MRITDKFRLDFIQKHKCGLVYFTNEYEGWRTDLTLQRKSKSTVRKAIDEEIRKARKP